MVLPVPKSFALATATLLLLLAPNAARSTLVGQTVGVSLTDGGSLSLSQSVVVTPSPEITPGDGSPIGGVLLPTESVDIGAQSIAISLEEGAAGGATGYPTGTHYTFSNLVFFGQSTEIVGIHVTTTNLTNLGSVTFTGDSVTVPIDTVKIGDLPPPAIDVGSMTIALDVVTVPEPATGALVTAGIVLLGYAMRGRPRAS
jgi:hypothetical protein